MRDSLCFDCDRTCPLAKERWCRFRPILDRIGPVRVDSHTAKVTVDYKDPGALKLAVEALGWEWMGQGQHHLFEGPVTGLAFKVPGWNYPVVLADGKLHMDTYNDRWGTASDLEKLKPAYARATVEAAALALGWLCERNEEGALIVHHPTGGVLTLKGEGLDLSGFVGSSCHTALMDLNLPLELLEAKPEMAAQQCQVNLPQQ